MSASHLWRVTAFGSLWLKRFVAIVAHRALDALGT
jgi:hypothetical protein